MVVCLASALRAGRIGGLVLIFSIALAASTPAFAQTTPTPATPTLTTLASLNGSDGAFPQAGLVTDSHGNLFGTASEGGDYFAGTVFEIVNNGTVSNPSYSTTTAPTTLFTFNYSDGALPAAGLILDAKGDLYGTTTQGGYDGNNACQYTGCGTVFELPYVGTTGASGTPTGYATTPTTMVQFNGNDGNDPIGGLTFDAKGNLLGTTYYGGDSSSCYYYNGCGTVFEIVNTSDNASSPSYSTTAAPNILYSFTAGNDGAEPAAGLLVDGAGNLIGTTSIDGGGEGAVFELPYVGTTGANGTSTGYATTLTTLASFPGGSGGANPQAGLIADSNGSLFGTTPGSYFASSDGTVFEIANDIADGATVSDPSYPTPGTPPTTLYSFSYNTGGYQPPQAGLIVDAKGDLFGTTYDGGTDGAGTIFEIANNGTVSDPSYSTTTAPTTLYTFTGGNDGANPEDGLIADPSGNLYGTTYDGGANGAGTVFELTNSGFVLPAGYEYAKLKIISGPTPGFDLQAAFRTGGQSLDPTTQPVTLTLGPNSEPSYTVTIPAGSFQLLPNGRYKGAWIFTGVIYFENNPVTVSVQIDPLGPYAYEFKANAFPVSLPSGLTTINVFIQIGTQFGTNVGSTTVAPSY